MALEWTKPSADTIATAHRLYGQGLSALQIGARLGFSDRAVHRWLKQPAPVLVHDRPDWVDGALCAQVDTELFFPEHGCSNVAALAICACCGVREQCLGYALDHAELVGVWGGTSERERKRLRRRR